jgi:hypothetical protein
VQFTANFVLISLILSTLMIDVICSSEMSVPKRAARRHTPEDGFLQGDKYIY